MYQQLPTPNPTVVGFFVEIEDAFRTLKQTLELRPVYHRLEERIRAHVLLCWVGLLLIRVAENETGQSWPRLRQKLERLELVEVVTRDGRITQRTEVTAEQKPIFQQLRIQEPPRIFQVASSKTRET